MALLKISEPGQSPMPHQFKRVVGIDLGTTHSLVAHVESGDAHGVTAKVILDEQGEALLPSVVHYLKDGTVEVGTVAKMSLVDDPANTLSSFKRWLGRNAADLQLQQDYQLVEDADQRVVTVNTVAGPVNAIQASSRVLLSLAKRAESYLGGDLHGAVITVPAYFDDAQRQATRDAARLAGINVLRLLNEPTAAAVAYGLDKADDRYIAVYDLGGGTFDISILQLSEGVFEVVATGGDSALGGDDLDREIANWVAEKAGFSLEDLNPADYRMLLQIARTAKQALSEEETTAIQFSRSGDAGGNTRKIVWEGELSRAVFESLIRSWIDKTLAVCKHSLRDAELGVREISDVVMVGGSTRVPMVRKAVAELFEQPVKIDLDPDQVVAQGAAIQAELLAGNRRQQDLLLLDVTPLSLGLEMLGGLVEKVIPRNTAIPVVRAQEFTTAKDGQTALSLHVVQGERERVEDCRSLARFTLTGIPPMVAGAAKILVTFAVNTDGILEVTAEETETGIKADIKIEPSSGLNEQQITDMLQSSFDHAEEDKQTRKLTELRVEARSLIDAVNSALEVDADLLDVEEQVAIDNAIEALESAIPTDDTAAISRATASLGRQTEEFAARRMDRSIKLALQGKSVDEVDTES